MESLFILSLLFIVSFCQQNWNGGQGDWYCSMLMNEDCTLHHLHERCGTDGITYRNMCDIGQAHCRNNVTNQLHEGPCIQSTSTTRSPEEVIHGSAIILDFQCTLLSHRECEFAYYEKICGTDGRTYPTFSKNNTFDKQIKEFHVNCEYEKARCTHRDLHVAKFGDCYA